MNLARANLTSPHPDPPNPKPFAQNDEARRKLTDKGASLVASLKLRVSRLEATLRAKEAELARLQASVKATTLNEMKIEAETYYQEVRAVV